MSCQTIPTRLWMALEHLSAASVARLRSVVSRAEEGQSMVEYAIIAALIAVACLAVVQAMGNGIAGVFQRILSSISNIG